MKYISTIIISLLILAGTYQNSNAQCNDYAKNVCKELLKPYFHDGNYNVAILSEGEKAELYKTFYTGQEYRIAICAQEPLIGVEFVVKNEDGKFLYSNKQDNYSATWDFKIDGTQQMIISLKVLEDNNKKVKNKGCVAIMFGLKD